MPWVERRSITRPERPREFYSAGVGSALSSGSRGLPSNSITSEDRGGGALQLILPNGVNERKSARATKLKLAGPRPGFQSGSRAPKVTRVPCFQAAGLRGLLTQGIGLRPQPWAEVSRPVGPDRPTHPLAGRSHRRKKAARSRDKRQR